MAQRRPPVDRGPLARGLTVRGFVYYAQVPSGRKPVVVVSSDDVSGRLEPVVARITSRRRPRALPTHVRLAPGEAGLARESFVLCHDLVTVTPDVLGPRPVGLLGAARMREVDAALKRALDLE